VIPQVEAGRPGADLSAALGGVSERLRPHLWLVGWWIVGRTVVFAAAMAVNPTVRTLDLWDGRWYRIVARDGYLLVPGRQSDPAFFPLYPVLLRVAHAVGIGYGVSGPLISNLALLGALVLFHSLTRDLFGADLARRATTYLAIFPLGYVFSMTYPESVVLALVLGAAIAATRGHWWLAAACGAAAALARPEGMFVAVPVAALAWSRRHELGPVQRGAAAGAVLTPAAALASYPLYLSRVLHDPLAWQRAEQAWGRRFRPSGTLAAVEQLPATLTANGWLVRDVVAFALYLALLAVAWHAGSPRAWLLAGVGIVVLPTFSGAFESIGRFGLLAPPLYWGLAILGRTRRADRAVRAASLVLLAGATLTLPYVFP
jgi:hypothetical protein